nr:amino acid permease [Ktedonobacteraceae bacterium]
MAQPDVSHEQNQRDEALLRRFGYTQELQRTLGFLSNFAVAFSYISVSTGTFSLFALGLAAGGPAFFWTWPIVAVGQFLVALNFAELASHFPIAGSIYQWSKRLSSPTLGWFTGWIYFFAGVLTVTAVSVTIPIPLLAIFPTIPATIIGIPSATFIALIAIIVCTIINVAGVRLVSIINNVGVVAEIVGMFGFALVLLLFFRHNPISFLFTGPHTDLQAAVPATATTPAVPAQPWTPGLGFGYFGAFTAALFMSLFVIYGFDTAGTLGEETRDPQRNAPRGVLWSIGLSFIAGLLFLAGTILSIKDYVKIEGLADGSTPTTALPTIIQDALGPLWGNIYLFVVLIAVFVCTLAIQSATIRLMFSMGRDGRLPFGKVWGTVNTQFRTPLWAGIAVGILAAIPFLYSQAIAVLVTGATGLIYLSYFMNNTASLNARLKGWPHEKSPFRLGRWGIPVNILALIYGGLMIINFLWFGGLRNVYTNPTLGSISTGMANIPVLSGIPIFEFSLLVLFVVGAIYWFGFKRREVLANSQTDASTFVDVAD